MMKEQRLEELFARFIEKATTQEDEQELMSLLKDPALTEKKKALIDAAYDQLPVDFRMSDKQADEVFRNIFHRSASFQLRKSSWKQWAAAASILLALALGGYFLLNKRSRLSDIAQTKHDSQDVKAPGTNRAMITLADGNKVFLDSVNIGQLAQVGNIKLVKLANGEVAYRTGDGQIIKELQYNTLTNPRGSNVVTMRLSDGSQVWLNAGSSITYPIAFVGNERKVELNGEGYFEIAHNASMPFNVKVGNMNVKVLGTHFNINSYSDEPTIKTTLLEGRVEVKKDNNIIFLNPGQQALAQPDEGKLRVVNDVNLDGVIAWKNGVFNFDNVKIDEAMRQLERWYDIDVVYENGIPNQELAGEMSKDVTLMGLLNVIKELGITYHLNGKKLIIINK
ncbi:MAG: FecR domain-containing protein [Niabella sp.]